jgi:hypothetical protein
VQARLQEAGHPPPQLLGCQALLAHVVGYLQQVHQLRLCAQSLRRLQVPCACSVAAAGLVAAWAEGLLLLLHVYFGRQ